MNDRVSQEAIEETAARLRAAYQGAPIAPLRDVITPTDAVGAYAVQSANTQFWLKQGRKLAGRKIGLTAEAVQKQLGVDQPDYGVLFQDMQIPDGGALSPSKVIQPKVEAEVALILARALDNPNANAADVEACVECVIPAIEIVDSRIAEWKITFADTVADNGSSAFYVLGEPRRAVAGLDLWTCGMALQINGRVASIGAGAACLGHPLNAAAWLARAMAGVGEGLRAGDVILTGALGPMVPLMPGDRVRASIGGLGQASFTLVDDRDG